MILFLWCFPFKGCLFVYVFAWRPKGKLLKYSNFPRVRCGSDPFVSIFPSQEYSYRTLFQEICILWRLLFPQLHALKRCVDKRVAHSVSNVPVDCVTWLYILSADISGLWGYRMLQFSRVQQSHNSNQVKGRSSWSSSE